MPDPQSHTPGPDVVTVDHYSALRLGSIREGGEIFARWLCIPPADVHAPQTMDFKLTLQLARLGNRARVEVTVAQAEWLLGRLARLTGYACDPTDAYWQREGQPAMRAYLAKGGPSGRRQGINLVATLNTAGRGAWARVSVWLAKGDAVEVVRWLAPWLGWTLHEENGTVSSPEDFCLCWPGMRSSLRRAA